MATLVYPRSKERFVRSELEPPTGLEKLRAENAKLRQALEQAAREYPYGHDPDNCMCPACGLVRIARKALR